MTTYYEYNRRRDCPTIETCLAEIDRLQDEQRAAETKPTPPAALNDLAVKLAIMRRILSELQTLELPLFR